MLKTNTSLDGYFDKINKSDNTQNPKSGIFGPMYNDKDKCIHDSCSECNGTGRKKNGFQCVHMISCKCSKCSPKY